MAATSTALTTVTFVVASTPPPTPVVAPVVPTIAILLSSVRTAAGTACELFSINIVPSVTPPTSRLWRRSRPRNCASPSLMRRETVAWERPCSRAICTVVLPARKRSTSRAFTGASSVSSTSSTWPDRSCQVWVSAGRPCV